MRQLLHVLGGRGVSLWGNEMSPLRRGTCSVLQCVAVCCSAIGGRSLLLIRNMCMQACTCVYEIYTRCTGFEVGPHLILVQVKVELSCASYYVSECPAPVCCSGAVAVCCNVCQLSLVSLPAASVLQCVPKLQGVAVCGLVYGAVCVAVRVAACGIQVRCAHLE